MRTYPNCKINLGLHVVGRRADGYHELQTVFLPVDTMRDELTVDVGPLAMHQEGLALDNAPDDNLCLRAWRLLHDEFHIPEVCIRLHKGIPFGAGLGGGSSDAACTLRMLSEMFALGLSAGELERRAVRLGADCPFFITGRAAYATGIGDRLEPLDFDLSIFNSQYSVQIEMPQGEHIGTREAYAELDSSLFGQPRVDLREAVRRPVDEWRDLIVNDFERSVFPAHPAIAALKDDMYRRGALYASMTGSGAAVFGLFKKVK